MDFSCVLSFVNGEVFFVKSGVSSSERSFNGFFEVEVVIAVMLFVGSCVLAVSVVVPFLGFTLAKTFGFEAVKFL